MYTSHDEPTLTDRLPQHDAHPVHLPMAPSYVPSFCYNKHLAPGLAHFLIAQSAAGAATEGSFETLNIQGRSALGSLTHFYPTRWCQFDHAAHSIPESKRTLYLERKRLFDGFESINTMPAARWCAHLHWHEQLYQNTRALLDPQGQKPLIVLGGDHGCSSATLKAFSHHVTQHLHHSAALLWMDAHLDLHTLASSQSGNWHGMPLANLLGIEPHPFSHTSFKPQHVFHFGARSFEPDEMVHAQQRGITLVSLAPMPHQQSSYGVRLIEALHPFFDTMSTTYSQWSQRLAPYALSLDLDLLSADDYQGTACLAHEPGGPTRAQILQTLYYYFIHQKTPMPMMLEIMEYHPPSDRHLDGIAFMQQLIDTVYWHHSTV